MKPRIVLIAEDSERVLVYLSDGNVEEYPKDYDLSKLKERLHDPNNIIDLHLKSRQKRVEGRAEKTSEQGPREVVEKRLSTWLM